MMRRTLAESPRARGALLFALAAAAAVALLLVDLAPRGDAGPSPAIAGNGDSTISWHKDPPVGELILVDGTETFTFDEVMVNQHDPSGLGGFSFSIQFDDEIWYAPVVDLTPAITLFADFGRTLDCSVTQPAGHTVHIACASTGTLTVGPMWDGPQVLAHVTLTVLPHVAAAILADPDGEIVTTVWDLDVKVVNTCGHPLNDGTDPGREGQQGVCQGVRLPGILPGGQIENPGKTIITIRRPPTTTTPTATPTPTSTSTPATPSPTSTATAVPTATPTGTVPTSTATPVPTATSPADTPTAIPTATATLVTVVLPSTPTPPAPPTRVVVPTQPKPGIPPTGLGDIRHGAASTSATSSLLVGLGTLLGVWMVVGGIAARLHGAGRRGA